MGDYFLDHPHAVCFLGVAEFACKKELESKAKGRPVGQYGGPADGSDASPDLGPAELGSLRGDAKVGKEGQPSALG